MEKVVKVGIIGPSRIGKTSIIAAVLSESRKLLADTDLHVRAKDGSPSERKISTYKQQIQGSIYAGEFDAGHLKGSQEPFTFEVGIHTNDEKFTDLNISLLDFPGGWLNPESRPPGRTADWEDCKKWINESSILIVPVDATLVMEAKEAKHKRALPTLLTMSDVEEVAHMWAKKQRERPLMLMICPVKCESYFDDNGGRKDQSEELYRNVHNLYEPILELVRQANKLVNIVYVPIDTIGCVEVKKSEWIADEIDKNKFDFVAHYRVRSNGNETPKQKTLAADTVLINICEHVLTLFSEDLNKSADTLNIKIDELKIKLKDPDTFTGWVEQLWQKVTGEQSKQKNELKRLEEEAEKLGFDVSSHFKILDEIKEKKKSNRVKYLK